MSEPWAWPLGLALLGAIAGSFLAALVIRWPAGRSIVRGRSTCDGCGRTLQAAELMPIVSALILRSRCATCGARIDPRHWQIEAAAALIGAGAGLATPTSMALAGALFGWLLLALAALDVAEFWLPDRLTGTVLVTGLALGVPDTLGDRLIGAAMGFTLLAMVAVGYKRLRGREGLGWGDPKLLAGIGAWLGWRMLPAVLLLAGLAGLTAVAAAMMRGRGIAGDTRVPFGALLAVAAYPAWLAVVGMQGMIALFLLLQGAPTLPVGAIGRQSLPDKGCAAYLWSVADRQLVAMATADPAQLRLAIDGKTIDYARVSQTEAGPTGLGGIAEYRGGDVVATLEMTVEVKDSLTQGARVSDGVLRIDRAGQDGIVMPVAGLVGCR